jgi:P4 family phage/plasmid primase-like protien
LTETGREFLEETQEQINRIEIEKAEMLSDYVNSLDIDLTHEVTDKETGTINHKRYTTQTTAKKIVGHSDIRIIRDKDTKILYCYTPTQGIYSEYGEDLIKLLCLNKTRGHGNISYANTVVDTIKALTVGKVPQSKKIAVNNGILIITENEVKLEPYTSKEFIVNKVSVYYNPDAKEKLNAKGQTIREFFKEVCPEDTDLLQEWSGYHLVRDMPYHKLMWLFGPRGRNAKGVWARLIQGIIGYDNCSNLSAEDLTGRADFALSGLNGKMANICPEPKSDVLLAPETLQSLTGMDTIDAKVKYVVRPLKFTNIAKITMMGNKYPAFLKPTPAFYKRVLLCVFPNTYDKNEVANIERIWLEDEDSKSAFLNWMIEGLQRLLRNEGKFTNNIEWEEKQRIFELSKDPLTKFIEDHVIFDSTGNIAKRDLQEAADNFCAVNKVPPIDIRKPKLQQMAPYAINDKKIRITIDGISKPVDHWIGVRLKTEKEINEEKQVRLNVGEEAVTHNDNAAQDVQEGTMDNFVTNVTNVTGKKVNLNQFSEQSSPYSTQR